MHGGYGGWSDSDFLAMPYARLVQELRLTAEAFQDANRNAWIQSAFVGWQVMAAQGGKVPPFEKYLRKIGLQQKRDRVTKEQVAVEKAKAFAALDLVERRFDGRNA